MSLMTINSAKETHRERERDPRGGQRRGCRGDELIFGINPIASGSSFAFKKKNIVKRQEEVPLRPSP